MSRAPARRRRGSFCFARCADHGPDRASVGAPDRPPERSGTPPSHWPPLRRRASGAPAFWWWRRRPVRRARRPRPHSARNAAELASSSTMSADLPPSSRKVRRIESAPWRINALPTAVDPVNEIMSTLGSAPSRAATLSRRGRDHIDDAGRDVGVLGDQPTESRAFHGVSVAARVSRCFRLPTPGASLWRVISIGKLDGMIAPTTPMGSLTTERTLRSPHGPPSSSTRCQGKSSFATRRDSARRGQRPVQLGGRRS